MARLASATMFPHSNGCQLLIPVVQASWEMEIPFSFRDAAESKQRHSSCSLGSLQRFRRSAHTDCRRDQHVLTCRSSFSAGGPQGRVSRRFSSDASSFTPIELLHGLTQRSHGRTLALVCHDFTVLTPTSIVCLGFGSAPALHGTCSMYFLTGQE